MSLQVERKSVSLLCLLLLYMMLMLLLTVKVMWWVIDEDAQVIGEWRFLVTHCRHALPLLVTECICISGV